MSETNEAGANRRGEPRVPFDGVVRLRYRLFRRFLEENAANISTGGMFIRTIHPGGLGTELDFEIRLDDDLTLIQGRGEVAWVRQGAGEAGTAPGMGIRFVELAGDSRALVDKIVRDRLAAGLELFDLDGQAPSAAPGERPAVVRPAASDDRPIWQLDAGSAAVGDAPPGDGPSAEEAVDVGPSAEEAPDDGSPAEKAVGEVPPAENLAALDPEMTATVSAPDPPRAATAAGRPGPAAAGRVSPLRLIAVAVVSALIGAGAVLTFYWLYVQPSIDSLETRIDELAGIPGGPWAPPADEPEPVVGDAGDRAIEGAPAAISRPGQSSEVVDALRGWAAAWTEQRTEDYFAYYATGFEPPGGLDRAAWEEARRARIARPRWIRVALTLVRVEPAGAGMAEASFVQSYRSERYTDLVKKRLRMVREDGGWKIAAERSEP